MALAIGGNSVNKAYLGSTEIQKMYLGSELVFSKGLEIPTGIKLTEVSTTGLTPIMTNFRVNEATPTHIHFDEPLGPATGLTTQGFTVSGKAVTNINTLIGYIEVDTPFTFWDNNTIRLESGDGTVYDFDLQHISNDIAEPSTSSVRYGSRLGSGTQDGLSEANAWSWAEVQSNAANGMLIWVKAGGDFSAATFSSNLTSTTPCIIKGYKTTIGDLDGVKFYTHVEGGSFDNTEAPTIVGGSNGIYAAGDNYIFKNFQAQDGTSRNFYTQDAQNIIFDNCASMDSGQAGLRSYRTDNVRFTNITSVNEDESALHLWDSNNSLIKDCLVITDGTFSGGDYYYQVHGSNNILTGLTANRNTLTSHSGHGISIKGSGVVTEYNLVEDCQLTSINMPIEARHGEVMHNVYRNIEHNNLIATAGNGGSLMIMNGPSFNTFDNVRLKDGYAGIRITSTTESSTNTTMGHDNIFKNCLFNNQIYGFLIPEDTSASGNYEFYNNQIINCSFIRTGSSQDFFSVASDDIRDNTIQNSIINGYGTEGTSTGFAFTYSNFYNAFTTPSGTGNINDNPTFEDTVDFRPTNDALISAVKLVDYDAFGDERASQTTMGYLVDADEVIEELPFRIISYEIADETATTAWVRAYMTENCSINYYVDGVKNAVSSDDFNAFEVAPNEWRHTRTLTGLTPDTTANLVIRVTAQDDGEEVQSGNIPITTLAPDYYVALSGDNTDGLTEATAFNTISRVNTEINNDTFIGKTVAFKRGDTFNGQILFDSDSGTLGNEIVFTAYGTGNLPIINTVMPYTDGAWVEGDTNIWRNTLISYNPNRIIIDGTEVQQSQSYAELGDDYSGTVTPNIATFWQGDNGDGGAYLYIYSTTDPNSRSIKFSEEIYTLRIKKSDHINISNLNLRGGYASSFTLSGANYINIINCDIGDMSRGGGGSEINDGVESGNIIIDNCNFDSKYTLDFSGIGAGGDSNLGTDNGYSGSSMIVGEIKNCDFINWGHTSMNIITNSDGTSTLNNVKIYGNTLTIPNLSYGGGVTFDRFANNCEFYNNTLDGVKNSQINGNNNHIHDNNFLNCSDSPYHAYAGGFGVKLQNYAGNSHDNTIEDNTFTNCAAAAIAISGNNGSGDCYGHIFRRNTINKCGVGAYGNNYGIQLDNNSSGSNDGQTFENNNIYSSATTDTIGYYGLEIDVTQFNANNGDIHNHTISGNTNNI